MLFEATHTHPAAQCPLLKPDRKTMIKQLFSEVNIKKAGLKIEAAYMSCPKYTTADHKGFFIKKLKILLQAQSSSDQLQSK